MFSGICQYLSKTLYFHFAKILPQYQLSFKSFPNVVGDTHKKKNGERLNPFRQWADHHL